MGDKVDGGILTFKAYHPRWSFVSLGEDGFVTRVAEKIVLEGNEATCGVYHWSKGSDYVKYAEQMIANDTRVNGEFFTAPVYNEAIADGKKIKIFHVDKMMGLGTPEDLMHFEASHEST